MTHESDAELWAEIEQEWLDLVMVLGAAEAAYRQMQSARAELEKALAALERARRKAERARARLESACETAEEWIKFAAAAREATRVM